MIFEQPKRHSCINVFQSTQKNLNEDRPILLVAKCRPMILVSRNIRYLQIFAGIPQGRQSWQFGSAAIPYVKFSTIGYLDMLLTTDALN